VLAVADGTVVGLMDGVPEPAKGAPPTPVSSSRGSNFIALKVGPDRVAFSEHLEPALLVIRGELIKRGQVIGHLGATGQAARPHLHFHLADGATPLGAEGQPYRLAGATVIGRYRSIESFGAGEPWAAPMSTDTGLGPSFPAAQVVVRFTTSSW
jgi:murein DD-endopeptidase